MGLIEEMLEQVALKAKDDLENKRRFSELYGFTPDFYAEARELKEKYPEEWAYASDLLDDFITDYGEVIGSFMCPVSFMPQSLRIHMAKKLQSYMKVVVDVFEIWQQPISSKECKQKIKERGAPVHGEEDKKESE